MAACVYISSCDIMIMMRPICIRQDANLHIGNMSKSPANRPNFPDWSKAKTKYYSTEGFHWKPLDCSAKPDAPDTESTAGGQGDGSEPRGGHTQNPRHENRRQGS
ncbi:hypothetical protein ABBQ38_003465 [Trebouxia sp. C0009 RCD-2024]